MVPVLREGAVVALLGRGSQLVFELDLVFCQVHNTKHREQRFNMKLQHHDAA
jgi:hypothetical protein